MSGTVLEWRYADSVDSGRVQRLISLSAFSEVVELVSDAQVVEFTWETFEGKALSGCNRASFLLKVLPETYDAFFNSPAGYRGQYALSPTDGEVANRQLLTHLEPKLLSFATERNDVPSSAILASLRAAEAKLWIDESEVGYQLGEVNPAILYAPWVESSESGVGLLAPVGTCLEVKGGWLDSQGYEQCNPAKAQRSNEIHHVGYS
jgi:hypothetical protein